MPNKQISLFANIIVPILIILVTIGLFFLFSAKEPGKLFYTNMGITILLECIFCGYLGVLRIDTNQLSGPFFAVLGIGAFYYVMVAATWMLVYSLLLSTFIPYTIYMSVHIVVFLLWTIVYSQIAQQDNSYKESIDIQQNRGKTLDYYAQRMGLLATRYQSALAEKAVKQPESTISIDMLINKMRGLAPSVFTINTAQSQLAMLIDRCEEQIAALEEATDDDTALKADEKIRRFIKNSAGELDMLRNLSRK